MPAELTAVSGGERWASEQHSDRYAYHLYLKAQRTLELHAIVACGDIFWRSEKTSMGDTRPKDAVCMPVAFHDFYTVYVVFM